MRTISLRQFADAVELNGYPIAKRAFFVSHKDLDEIYNSDDVLATYPPGDLVQACAIGQAALNLGVGPNNLWDAFSEEFPVVAHIVAMNDTGKTPKQIARWIRTTYKDSLDSIVVSVDEFDYGKVFNNYQGKKV